jgi:chemotaxis signal transduction protein
VKKIQPTEFRYSILCISDQYFGVEVKYVREVLLHPAITKMPNVHKCVIGVFNLRGTIQSVIDIRSFLNLPAEKNEVDDFVVLFEYNQITLGLIVKRVLDVVQLDASKIQIPTRDMSLSLIHYCTGYYNDKKLGNVFLLDLETLFSAKEIGGYSYSMGA